MKTLTAETIKIPGVIQNIVKPEFIRLPRDSSLCPYTGLSRGGLNHMILGDSPLVKSIVVRRKGTSSGTRLIDYNSLINYLRSME